MRKRMFTQGGEQRVKIQQVRVAKGCCDCLSSGNRFLVAYRVLDNHEEVEDAVQNCVLAASCSVPQFENEGAFRSWLVRVLIDEALAIRYKDWIESTTSSEPILDSLNLSPTENGEQCNSTSGNW